MEDFSLVRELKQEGQRWVWDAAFSGDDQYIFSGKLIGWMNYFKFQLIPTRYL